MSNENRSGGEFLDQTFNDLRNSPEVTSAARHNEADPDERVSHRPVDKIANYLARLERLALDPESEQRTRSLGDHEATARPRALSLLREMVMNQYVRPHAATLAQGAARVEERAARELGIAAHYGEEQLEQRGEIAVQDLEGSLDQWLTYLSDPNESYPTWFRYYVFRNVLNLGEYDKDRGEFPKRSEGTVRLFPDIDRGSLAYVQQLIEASQDQSALERLRQAQLTTETPADQLITPAKATVFARLSFAKQYAEGIRQSGEITPEMRAETRGEWVTYEQGSDPTKLWASLQNKGTAWCTKGFSTAGTQLAQGDFHVYYTLDQLGNPTIPRIAIRMQEGKVFEVRGVADTAQNLEGNMIEESQKKVSPLPGAEAHAKKSADMRQLTNIEKKTKQNQTLTPSELKFLYELDTKIEGFGYQRDPRITELRERRDPLADAAIIFECTPEQIAHGAGEITTDTKAYIGRLEPGIFDLIQQNSIDHVFTTFPEGKISRVEVRIGGKTAQELQTDLNEVCRRANGEVNISPYAQDILNKIYQMPEFTKLVQNPEQIQTVRLKVSDLGFESAATTDQIYARAAEMGLELCQPEVGPYMRLKDTDQPLGEWYRIAMKQISARNGNPYVFNLERNDVGLWLYDDWAQPTSLWKPDNQFLFRLRQQSLET